LKPEKREIVGVGYDLIIGQFPKTQERGDKGDNVIIIKINLPKFGR
jgi:hypothetical protein